MKKIRKDIFSTEKALNEKLGIKWLTDSNPFYGI